MKHIMQSVKYVLLILLLCVNGCFSSIFTLGSPEAATVSRIYVGDWILKDQDNARLTIRSLDDKAYIVALSVKGEQGVTRVDLYRGFTATIDEVTFAHLCRLEPDSAPEKKWLLARVAITDEGKIVIRQLNVNFFEGKTIQSNEDLVKMVKANIENDAMYDSERLIGTPSDKEPTTSPVVH